MIHSPQGSGDIAEEDTERLKEPEVRKGQGKDDLLIMIGLLCSWIQQSCGGLLKAHTRSSQSTL